MPNSLNTFMPAFFLFLYLAGKTNGNIRKVRNNLKNETTIFLIKKRGEDKLNDKQEIIKFNEKFYCRDALWRVNWHNSQLINCLSPGQMTDSLLLFTKIVWTANPAMTECPSILDFFFKRKIPISKKNRKTKYRRTGFFRKVFSLFSCRFLTKDFLWKKKRE